MRVVVVNVAVVIVNFRTPALTLDYLCSLSAERESVSGLSVVVIDGGSYDDSPLVLEKAVQQRGWQNWVTLRCLNDNGGFAYANNAGICHLLEGDDPPEFIWLLNPDTVIRAGATVELVRFLRENQQCGIAGSRLEDPDQTIQRSAFRFHTVLSEIENALSLGLVSRFLRQWQVAPEPPTAACRTDWVCGASMMVRPEVFRQIGLLDCNPML